jgi:DNA-binding beta-propeller fold protein YncE
MQSDHNHRVAMRSLVVLAFVLATLPGLGWEAAGAAPVAGRRPSAMPAPMSRRDDRMLWKKRYAFDQGNGGDTATSVAASPDGTRVFVAGQSDGGPSGYDIAVIAYDPATGRRLWVTRYDGGDDDLDPLLSVSPDSATVFVAEGGGPDGGEELRTIAYDAETGAWLWSTSFSQGDVVPAGIAVSGDGSRVFVTGTSNPENPLANYATVAYDAATGTQLWKASYDGPRHMEDFAAGIAVDPSGSTVVVTGTTERSGDFATVAYDAATGVQRWVAFHDSPDHGAEWATDVAIGPGGSTAYVTGEDDFGGPDDGFATVAYDLRTGHQRWVSTYGLPDTEGRASELAVTPNGRQVMITGYIGRDFATESVDAVTGKALWADRYVTGTAGWGWALAVSPDGSRVFVTGRSDGPNGAEDYATIAYRSFSGRRLWVERFDDRRHQEDIPLAIAVSPDGAAVFVTGASAGADNWDFATLAYRA